jgi:glucans biosynthesis protein
MVGDHPRNTAPMNAAPRCGARTRSGSACLSPAISGKSRCRLHGGKSTGALQGNQNALKHGLYTAPPVLLANRAT